MALCKSHYTEEQIDAWLEGRTPEGYLKGITAGSMFMAEVDGLAVGFGHAAKGELLAVFVDPRSIRRGVGRALCECGMRLARGGDGKVSVRSTLNAVGFYKRLGFVQVGQSADYDNGVAVPVALMETITPDIDE